jgi:hypothetical protein
MMLSGVIDSHAPLREKFAVRSEEDCEILRRKTIKANLHQGQLGRQSYGKGVSTLRDNDTRPAKFSLFCDYKGRLSRRSRVRGYQAGTGSRNRGIKTPGTRCLAEKSPFFARIYGPELKKPVVSRTVTLSVAWDGECDLHKAVYLPKWSPRDSRR